MATGTLVEGGGGREENKLNVYTRKRVKRKQEEQQQREEPPSSQTLVSDDGNNSSQQPQPSAATPSTRLDLASDDSTSLQHPSQVVVVVEEGAVPEEHEPSPPVATATSTDKVEVVVTDAEAPTENGGSLQTRENGGSLQTTENYFNIALASLSKQEIPKVKQKLVDQLENVRELLKRIEAKALEIKEYVAVEEGVVGEDVDVDGYSNSQLSANDVVENGGDSIRIVPEVSLEVVGGRRMIPEVYLDNGGVGRPIPEFSLDDGNERITISEDNLGNGGVRRMISEGNVDNGGVRRMIPEVNFDNYGARRMFSEVNSFGKREHPKSFNQLRVSVMENSHGGLNEYADKEKRTPKANQFYRSSDFIVGKEKFPPPGSNKKQKVHGSKKHGRGGGESNYHYGIIKHNSQVYKNCCSLLSRLMKHKHGWVFNTPVDVKGLGLHDYFDIIKHPMDLGTVKSRLNTIMYKSPVEFAADVRLTFSNAMTYNPKGQDVHIMAEQLSHIFEDRWRAMENEFCLDSWLQQYREVSYPTPVMNKAPYMPAPEMFTNYDRPQSMLGPVNSKPKLVRHGSTGRGTALKKPKAKDEHKRDMTYDEKQKLSTNLQNMPVDKLENIVEIIRRRSSSLVQSDDAIEVDIDSVDNETLWELDRFVTNYKKSLSKYKRKAELAMQAREAAERLAREKNQSPVVIEVSKETKLDENKGLPTSLQVDKQQDNSSRSSSSSSSSSDSGSSSSDSDSDSSSESDAAQSPKT
ncbi:Transcription factor gte4 [Thalictrum thalictroides]|uniref:Transcription factor gte4 n=1 Tax=Thalictrum thalictroides TaxID=46969 RepID=A0A7J6V7Y3_THATH|nr:Transcription factor gte4 [Thalictrum thalictroides]